MKELLKGFDVIGIRTTSDDEHYSIGDTCRRSYDWDYDLDCSSFNTEDPVKLNGTCAIALNINEDMTNEEIQTLIKETVCNYAGDQVIIIGGNYTDDYCNDENEVIIGDAQVIAII